MKWFRKWLDRLKKKKDFEPEEEAKQKPSFFLYVANSPGILTWMRREKGISRKNLELTLIDNEEEPAWQVAELIELLTTDLNLLYILTDRAAAFEELAEKAFRERGLLIILMSLPGEGRLPGNLTMDLREWEEQLQKVTGTV